MTIRIMDGFGAAITGSAAYVINRNMSAAQRSALFDELFTSAGLGMNYVRRPMGASDFDLESYTHNDLPRGSTDPDLVSFSIDSDRTDIIPVFKEALQANPDLKRSRTVAAKAVRSQR